MKILKHIAVVVLGVISLLYLLNPTAGFFEILPDNLPGVGNIDEAGATALLLACLAYYGIDATRFFGNRRDEKK